MIGREQPYLGKNGTECYDPTDWIDDVPGIQDGTPQDEQHFNNMECGINVSNLTSELLTEVVKKHGMQIANINGDVITVTLNNTMGAFFNNSVKTVALKNMRDTVDYTVECEVQGDVNNVGDVVVFDKQLNGFKVKYTGSASTVTLKLYVHGGNAA
ncbi:MAG: hypothetical protein SO130_11025 [Agathobacter sp.]|nr:hypothetical protein [Agathobacter sp.]